MGQTVSVSSDDRAIYITSVDGIIDAVSQIVVVDSRLDVSDVVPEPGWAVAAINSKSWVIRNRPNHTLTSHDRFDQTRIARLNKPISVKATYYITDSVKTDYIGSTDNVPYVCRRAESTKIPMMSMRLEMPALVIVDPHVTAIIRLDVVNAVRPIRWRTSPNFAITSKHVLRSLRTMPMGDMEVHIVVTDATQTTVSKTMVVRVVDGTQLSTSTTVAVNPGDRVRLPVDMFAFPASITHILLNVPGTITLFVGSTTITNESIILSRADAIKTVLGRRTLLGRGPMSSSIADRSRHVDHIDYWISSDGGLAFTAKGALRVAFTSCFDGNAVVCVGIRNHRCVWRRVASLRPACAIMGAGDDEWYTIKRVHVTDPVSVMMVVIDAHYFGPNRPNKPLYLTTNHKLTVPTGQIISAGQLAKQHPGITYRQLSNIRLYHIETRQSAHILVNNILIEPMNLE